MLQTLLAMRAHITFAPLDTNRHPRYAAALRFLGIEVRFLVALRPNSTTGPKQLCTDLLL